RGIAESRERPTRQWLPDVAPEVSGLSIDPEQTNAALEVTDWSVCAGQPLPHLCTPSTGSCHWTFSSKCLIHGRRLSTLAPALPVIALAPALPVRLIAVLA